MGTTSPEIIADQFLHDYGQDGLVDLERRLIEEDAALEEQIAVKLALSKDWMRRFDDPIHISFVFAMYKETRRILRPDQDPLGEDFVNRKADQLSWLFDGGERWDLVIVDDGCPDGSGQIAERIVSEQHLESRVRILYLADAIETRHPVVANLSSTDDSRKGGAIQLGMHEASGGKRPGQIIAYTDADMSTNLGQAGLLARAIAGGSSCAAGSRREPTSVVVKGGARNDRGKLFIYIWKQMLPQLGDIIDSQCGFKAFKGEIVPELVADTIEKKFAFDIELLLLTKINYRAPIARVPVAWVDSEQASTTTDLEPYLPMLQAVARMYRRYSPPDERAERFVELVESIDEDGWRRLVTSAPRAITEREPSVFTDWAGVDAEDLAALI